METPKEIKVTVIGPEGPQPITIRQLRAKDAFTAFSLLANHLLPVIGSSQGGNITLDASKLRDLIAGSEVLTFFLVSKSTGTEQAFLEQLSTDDFLALMEPTIDLNINLETWERFKAFGQKLKGLVGERGK